MLSVLICPFSRSRVKRSRPATDLVLHRTPETCKVCRRAFSGGDYEPETIYRYTLILAHCRPAGPVSVCTEANLPAALSGGLALCFDRVLSETRGPERA